MTQQVTVTLLDLALTSLFASLVTLAVVLMFVMAIQASASRRANSATPEQQPKPTVALSRGQWWKQVRQARMDIARGRCEVCNAGNVELHAHHRTYAREGRERVEDLIILCTNCHGLYHGNLRMARRPGTAKPEPPTPQEITTG